MSELIEIHQLDYKACSLTYGEGACTASSSTRPAGETTAAFNGSTSQIAVSPFIQSNYTTQEIRLKFNKDQASSNNGSLYVEYFTTNGAAIDYMTVSVGYSGGLGMQINLSIVEAGQGANSTYTAGFPASQVDVDLKVVFTKNGTNTDVSIQVDDGTPQLVTLNKSLGNYTAGFISNEFSSRFEGKIWDLKAYRDGVLVRDLPLLTNADDLTGNSTPVATDVFTLTCPSITRDVAEFNGSSSKIEYGLLNNFGAYIPFQTNTYIFECVFFDLPTVGQHQIYDSTGTHFYFSGGSGALSLIVEGYSCGSFVVTSEIQQQAGFKLVMTTNGTTADYEAFINGSSIGTLTRNPSFPPSTATTAKLGEYRNVGINADFKMADWKTYKNGVLETDIPLIDSATDQTGNSTPTATDVSFVSQSLSGVDPNDPTQCALIENPDGKCFNTYATCQDIANYSQTSKTLTFAKKQAAALPLESLQRVEGTGAEFNGTSSKISTTAVAQDNSSLYEYEAFIKLDSYTGSRKVFGEYSSNNNGFAVKINNGSINVYLQNNPSAYGRDFFFAGYDFLSGETLKITLEKKSGATNQTVCKVYINGNFISPGSSTNSDILLGLGNYTLLEIGQSTFGSSLGSLDFEGAIKNFTVKKDGVLVRDLPLLTDATDNTGNTTPVATDVTFTGQTIDYKAALPHIPLLDSSSTKSGELNIGARRSVSGPLGKYSSASVTMTDETYSDNLTDPYIAERTYNPLLRGTFWSKFLAQNPYHEGDTYRIYNGEAGQDLASMPFKQFIVDRITAPNSGGNVSIKLVDQFRKLDPAKAIFLNLGVNKLTLDLTATASDVITDYTFADLERDGITSAETSPQNNYIKIGAEIIKVGGVAGGSGLTFDFSSCQRGLFGTTAVEHAAGELIQACYYFTPSVTNPSDQRGLYFYLQTLFNAAGISDSFLDLANWESEITSRLYLFNDVERLITEPTNINQLIGELQRDCGFFTWFDETDKKIKLKAVRPEIGGYTIDENKNLIAGKTSHSIESNERISEVWSSYGVKNQVESLDNNENYSQIYVKLSDGANPFKYGQRLLYQFKSPWIQNEFQVKRAAGRILNRYDDNTRFINFSLDYSFNVRMGDVFRLAYSGFTDATGQAAKLTWQVISLDRIDNEIKIKAQEFYISGNYGVWADNTIPNYSNSTDEQRKKYTYWNRNTWG